MRASRAPVQPASAVMHANAADEADMPTLSTSASNCASDVRSSTSTSGVVRFRDLIVPIQVCLDKWPDLLPLKRTDARPCARQRGESHYECLLLFFTVENAR